MMNPFFSDMLIGSGVLLIVLMLLWIASKWHYSNITDGFPDYDGPIPPPAPIEPQKTTGMLHIDTDRTGDYFVSIVAANHEVLQHGEGIKTKQSLRKHIAAIAKATNSNGLTINDKTGDFPDLHNYTPKKKK